MVRAAALLITVLLAVAAGAQQPGSGTPAQADAAHNTRTGPLSISGCLRPARGGYTLVQQDTSQAFMVNGDTAELSRAAGHQVRVQATELPPLARKPPQALPRLQARSIEILGNECATNLALPANGVSPGPSPQRGTVQETSPYAAPGSMGTSAAPEGPGTGQNVNGRAEGAPSPGSGDPRNLSPSPQGVPENPPQTDTGKTTTSGKKTSKQKSEDQKPAPPQ